MLGLLVRATFTYVFLLLLVRLSGKRTVLEGTPFDLVVALVIGDMPDDVIWGEVPLAQGIVAMGALVLLHTTVVYAAYRHPLIGRLVGSRASRIIHDGRRQLAAMARERINEADLRSHLRSHAARGLGEVREVHVEPSGALSVVRVERAKPAERRDLSRLRAALRR
jgi:uncharacterized membrane protein YcaP (DUF421 family)